MSLRVAVTGANGFVGRSLVRYASALGHEIVGLVRNGGRGEGGGRRRRPSGRSFRTSSPKTLAPALAGCRAVVHLAQIGAERRGPPTMP